MSGPHARLAILVFAAAAVAVSPSYARQDPAPIVYKGQGTVTRAAAEAQPFRYPDEPMVMATVNAPQAAPAQPVEVVALARSPATDAVFTPAASPSYDERGVASWYGEEFHGQPTANGETFDMNALMAAHPTLPLPSLVQVINLDNGKEVVVRVNDRGPFVAGRLLDVSRRAADVLEFRQAGQANVRVKYLGPAPVRAVAQTPTTTQQPRPAASPAPVVAPTPRPVNLTPAPEAPPAPRSVASVQKHYVQVGAFSDISNAQRLHAALSVGQSVEILPKRTNGMDLFRVMVGPLSSRTAADALRAHLSSAGVANGFVVSAP